jgi:hypothetical protein
MSLTFKDFQRDAESDVKSLNSNLLLTKFSFNSSKKGEGSYASLSAGRRNHPGVAKADGDWLAVQVRLIRNAHILKRG